jgi:hypothetical protein
MTSVMYAFARKQLIDFKVRSFCSYDFAEHAYRTYTIYKNSGFEIITNLRRKFE